MTDHEARALLVALRHLRDEIVDLNGRVRGLELWRARLEGVQWAVGRLPTLIACLSGIASTVAVLVVLLH